MERNEKIRIAVITIIMFVIAFLFFMSRSTDLSYNDWWVKGKTIEEVEARYGESHHFGDGRHYGYYLGVDNFSPMPSRQKMYYMMTVDDNGIVIAVEIRPYSV